MSDGHRTRGADVAHRVIRVVTQVADGLIGASGAELRASWAIGGPAGRQDAAEIEVARTGDFADPIARAHVPGAEQLAVVVPGGPFTSREIRYVRIRASVGGAFTPWSDDPCRIEAGLLDAADWLGSAISLPDDPGATAPAPSPLLRTTFDVADVTIVRARLYATAHGVYQMQLNAEHVAPDLLAPGWTTYHHRLLAQTYDVADRLRRGQRNCIAATLGDGWYRGRLGWTGTDDRCRYGDTLALLAQLEIDYADGSRQVVPTGPDWRASVGQIRSADLYDGSVIDFRHAQPGWQLPDFDDDAWQPVALIPIDMSVIEPWSSPPVRPIERRPVEITESIPAADGGEENVTRIDVGQNISGYLSIEVRGRAGDEIVVEHAEVTELDGALHRTALRTAEARDCFVLANDATIRLEPAFTFHGFRHAEIRTTADILGVEAVAISSDLARRSTFECADPRLNQLASNVYWSLRDNFVSVPTDCPQRDERMGWTGDAQAFASTASLIVDARQFWSSWLRDLALDQRADGIPSVIPDVVLQGEASRGRAGWADAATVVPWACYEAYGDPAILAAQLPSMVRWVETQRAHRHVDGPERGLVAGEFQFGDWLDPDAPSDQPWKAKADGDYLANAFFAHSSRLTAQAGRLLGHRDIELEYTALGDEIAELTWRTWSDHVMTSQTGCAVAVAFDIPDADKRPAVAARLADLVLAANGAVSTGFLGTSLVLPALARHGLYDAAYTMLLRTESPSWLYQVAMGATTTWERWDAIRPDGSIHDGNILPHEPGDRTDGHHMLSFNHYAYGSVLDWICRHLGGVSPVTDHPGYRSIRFAPHPCSSIDWAATSIETDLGTASIRWDLAGDCLTVHIEVPFGCRATVALPTTDYSTIHIDRVPAIDPEIELAPGRHEATVSHPRVHTAFTAKEPL